MKSSKVGSSMDRAQISLIWSQALKKRAHSTFFRSDGKLWGHWKSDLAWEKKTFGDFLRRYLIEKKNEILFRAGFIRSIRQRNRIRSNGCCRISNEEEVWMAHGLAEQARAGAGSGRAVHEVNLKVVHGQIFVSVSFGAEIFGAVFVKMPPKKNFWASRVSFWRCNIFWKVARLSSQDTEARVQNLDLIGVFQKQARIEFSACWDEKEFREKKIMVGILEQWKNNGW